MTFLLSEMSQCYVLEQYVQTFQGLHSSLGTISEVRALPVCLVASSSKEEGEKSQDVGVEGAVVD